jgi:hypothetical protein
MGNSTLCLFSSVSGRVVRGGAPVPNLQLKRKVEWAWGEKTVADTATTNENGDFTFPAIFEKSKSAGILPHEPCLQQTITVEQDSAEVMVWSYFHGSYIENSELEGRPLKLLVDLNEKPQRRDGFYGIAVLAP